MHLTSLHTHTFYCDGKYSAEDMILAAIKNNMQSIGISTHGPTPFVSDWNIKNDNIDKYIDEINQLKEKYRNNIEIYLGMEVDYIPGIGFDDFALKTIKKLDYYVGSLHYLGRFKNGIMWTVDYDLNELLRGIDESFGGNKRLAVETYYDLIAEMAFRYGPPVIGHLDLFKKNNKDNIIFDEREDWYVNAVDKCLNVIKNTPCVIEINTGGISRGYIAEQYPSTFIIKMILEKEIPVIINSDAHTTDGITCKFDEMYKLIYDIGFRKSSYLTKNGWQEQAIEI